MFFIKPVQSKSLQIFSPISFLGGFENTFNIKMSSNLKCVNTLALKKITDYQVNVPWFLKYQMREKQFYSYHKIIYYSTTCLFRVKFQYYVYDWVLYVIYCEDIASPVHMRSNSSYWLTSLIVSMTKADRVLFTLYTS